MAVILKRGETMTASIISKTVKNIVAASAALIMAASVAACGPAPAGRVRSDPERRGFHCERLQLEQDLRPYLGRNQKVR